MAHILFVSMEKFSVVTVCHLSFDEEAKVKKGAGIKNEEKLSTVIGCVVFVASTKMKLKICFTRKTDSICDRFGGMVMLREKYGPHQKSKTTFRCVM